MESKDRTDAGGPKSSEAHTEIHKRNRKAQIDQTRKETAKRDPEGNGEAGKAEEDKRDTETRHSYGLHA